MAWDNPPSEVDFAMIVTSVTSEVVGTNLVGELVVHYTMDLTGFQPVDRNIEASGGSIEAPSPAQVDYPTGNSATITVDKPTIRISTQRQSN